MDAIASFLLALPALICLRLKPEECGLSILKDDSEKKEKEKIGSKRQFRISDPVFIGICVIYGVISMITNISAHFAGYAETINMTYVGASMISSMMIGGTVFKVIMGFASDRFGIKTTYPLTIIIVFIGAILMTFGRNVLMLILGSFLFGCTMGNKMALNPLIRYCYGDEQYPEVYSKAIMFSAVGWFGGPVAGYLYDFTGSYNIAFYAAVILCIVCLIIYYVTISIVDNVKKI